jgi:4-hydroxy-tetrahydrodipicolinate reductase
MKKVRVLVIGSAGRMGQTILDVATRIPEIAIAGKLDQGDAIEPAMKDCDVAIDFSHADAVEEICRAAREHGKALVIGTTAHTPAQRKIIETTAQNVPVVFASNFSVGVNTLFALAGKAAQLLGDEFKIEIVETHHVKKKDAPSGTAKTLAEILKTARGSENEIPIESIREGEIVGDHTVMFVEPTEKLELTHRAGNREIFAKGALRAAQWVVGQPAGLYSMQDVLGL